MSTNPDSAFRDRAAYRGRFADNGGFTLVEVLVAFAVMAMLLTVMFRGVVTIRSSAIAFDKHTSRDIAIRSVLNDVLAKRSLPSGTYEGIRDGLGWRIVAKSIDLVAQLPPRLATSSQNTSDPSIQGPAVADGAGQAQAVTSSGNPTSTDKANEKPKWKPQRLIVRMELNGRPIEIETIRLVEDEPRA